MKIRFTIFCFLLITIHLITNHCLLWGAADHVIISEFSTHSSTSTTSITAPADEFIELYNPTSKKINLTNWVIQYSEGFLEGSLPDSKSVILEIYITSTAASTTINGYGHFLIAISTEYTGSATPDMVWDPSKSTNVVSTATFPMNPDTDLPIGLDTVKGPSHDLLKQGYGTLKVLNSSRTVIDTVGWGTAVDYEGVACTIQDITQKCIKRLPENEDTNNNYLDFRPSDFRDPTNSLFVSFNPSLITVSLSVSPRVFSPDIGQKCAISYSALTSSRIKIRIFDVLGRQVRTLLYDYPGGNWTKYWDGKDDMQAKVNIGLYIIHLQSYDENGRQNGAKMSTVAIGTPLQ
jgi:hypothetical protein